MTNQWVETTWGDAVDLKYGKAIRGYQDANEKYAVFGTNGKVGTHSTFLSEGPGVILGRKGAYRGVHFSMEPFHVIDTAYYVVPKQELAMRWLYYAMQYYEIGLIDDGSPIPSTTRAAVYTSRFMRPPLLEQECIASCLAALDDKIELNRRMNETLEEMARALFRDWFVDFGPTRRQMEGATDPAAIMGHAFQPEKASTLAPLFPATLGEDGLPEGWSWGTVSDVADLNPDSWTAKKHPNHLEYVDLSNTKWGRVEETTEYAWKDAPSRAKRILEPNDTIVGTVRPGNGSYSLIGQSGLTGSTGFAVLRPKHNTATEYVYLALTSPENIAKLANLADGGAYPAINPKAVAATRVVLPGDVVIKEFSAITQSLFAKRHANDQENQTLSALRDLLLPKLMSGEIRLKDGEAKTT